MQSKFRILGDRKKFSIGIGCEITREPWPFFDVKGGGIELGDYVVVSSGVNILTHTHQFTNPNWRNLDEIRPEKPTIIGSYVFLGINCIIMPSCKTVGDYSVIGAGSVVTKNVPDYEIWAGNPAIKIGEVNAEKEKN